MATHTKQSSKADRPKKTLVLCFDGTGNKFQGNAGDSNVIKIFSCLDREDPNQNHYYQPGIGTYTSDPGLVHASHYAKIKSWYQKSKDAAIGTGFENHVMGGYKFLMRYYQPGDDIYFFGFSRGAYTARFLAQMLDHVGLLAPGNEELIRFAWKTFAKWQQCHDSTAEERKAKRETYEFMKKFRSTFSVPVKRLRFLGLFDTVNSVAAFEGAFLQRRTKFPYTAKSSAKVIRHAVSIDERRAKFRQDLLGQKRPTESHPHHQQWHDMQHRMQNYIFDDGQDDNKGDAEKEKPTTTNAKPSANPARVVTEDRFQPRASRPSMFGHELTVPRKSDDASSTASVNLTSSKEIVDEDMDGVDDNAVQDIQEVWFPGCHADIGGGWPLAPGEEVALSHPPLMWMIREAHKAGLPFDREALLENNFILQEVLEGTYEPHPTRFPNPSELDLNNYHDAREVQTPRLNAIDGPKRPGPPVVEIDGRPAPEDTHATGPQPTTHGLSSAQQLRKQRFLDNHTKGSTEGHVHDVLQLKNGVGASSVASWNMMEWMPFRRMDLQHDGSWKAIRLPLPRGETRDIPDDAWIHSSAVRRMEADKKYRPGNLIVGGGGRGMREAPKEVGIGKWKVIREEGDPVGEVVVRAVEAGNLKKLKA